MRFQPAQHGAEHRISAQIIMVDHIFVAERDSEHPLSNQGRDIVDNPIRRSSVPETILLSGLERLQTSSLLGLSSRFVLIENRSERSSSIPPSVHFKGAHLAIAGFRTYPPKAGFVRSLQRIKVSQFGRFYSLLGSKNFPVQALGSLTSNLL